MKDVMLDLETWGVRPGCAIRSIGAVFFDRDVIGGKKPTTFYRNVSLESCEKLSLRTEGFTIAWWDSQSDEAKGALLKDQLSIVDVAEEFHEWFLANGGVYLWCHGATFDEPIWGAACARAGIKTPWKFWNVRCTRTLYDVAGFDKDTLNRSGTHHNALDDAAFQATCVYAAFRKLKGELV